MATNGVQARPGLERVGDLIDVVLSKVAHADVGPVMRLRRDWHVVAGPLAAVTAPLRLRNGRLTVEVASGAVATKVRYSAEDLVGNAQRVLGRGVVVSSISIRVARAAGKGEERPQ